MGVRLADLTNVPMTMAEAAAARVGKTIEKGKTRLEIKVEATPVTKIDEKTFRTQVWNRDQKHCRCCGRKVIKTIDRVPNRGEVNHIHGRTGDLRFEVRAAILMCLQCHERFTGRVNKHRLQIIASKTFTIRQGTFTDATYPVTFKEVA
jgi:5-methylcytosine-specific restriction endonuclease McrA